MNYFIGSNNNMVQLWSAKRLPFEPKGWLLEMRNKLKEEISSLISSTDDILYAKFCSVDTEFFDVENVLIYNVGTGTFKHLATKGLCLERVYKTPPIPPSGLEDYPLNYHFYQTIQKENLSFSWKKDFIIASWKDIIIPHVKSDMKPHTVWHAMKNGKINVQDKPSIPKIFGITLNIKGPKGKTINLASVSKPLIDGIISSFHKYSGSNIDIVSDRLAKMLHENNHNILQMLSEENLNVLGERNLIYPYRKGVQWNPADDNCIRTEIYFEESTEKEWRISGELYQVVT